MLLNFTQPGSGSFIGGKKFLYEKWRCLVSSTSSNSALAVMQCKCALQGVYFINSTNPVVLSTAFSPTQHHERN